LLKGHASYVNACCFSPDGKRIASASSDNSVRVWDADTGKEILMQTWQTGSVMSCCFSPDGKRIACTVNNYGNNNVRVWDADTGKEIIMLKGHTGHVEAYCFSPDGKRIASASTDHMVRVWDADTGKEILMLEGYTYGVSACCFSPDGKRIASTSADKTVRVWDADTGKILIILVHPDFVNNCCFSPDGKRIASTSADKTVRVWDVDTGINMHTLIGSGCCFSPDGKRIAVSSGGNKVHVLDSDTGKIVNTLNGHAFIWGLGVYCFFSDGIHVLAKYRDNNLCIWNADTGNIVNSYFTLGDILCINLSNNNKRIVAGDMGGNVYILSLDAEVNNTPCIGNQTFTPNIVDSIEKLNAQNNIDPQNIYNRNNLTDPIDVIESIAITLHEEYISQLMNKGADRTHAKDWAELPDELKESNRSVARGIFEKLNRLGLLLKQKSTINPGKIEFTLSEIEIIAEMEHERWVLERKKNGWKYGQVMDYYKKTHPAIIPWAQLSEHMKDMDRDFVKSMPVIMDKAGFTILKPEDVRADDNIFQYTVIDNTKSKKPWWKLW
jgi:WD40 repeat protein